MQPVFSGFPRKVGPDTSPQITIACTGNQNLELPGITWSSSLAPDKCLNGTLIEVMTATFLIIYDRYTLESFVK